MGEVMFRGYTVKPLFPVVKEKAPGTMVPGTVVPYGAGSKPRPMGGDSLLTLASDRMA